MKTTLLRLAIAVPLALGMAEAGEWRMSSKDLAPLAPPKKPSSCLSYDYLDFDYSFDDYDSPFRNYGNSFGLGFSKSLGSTFFLTGSYRDGDFEYDAHKHPVNVERRRYRLGLGARRSIGECVDLTFEGGAEHFDSRYTSCPVKDYDSWAYYAGPGIRAQYGKFEVFAKALYFGREGDRSQEILAIHPPAGTIDDDDGWVLSPGMIFHLSDHLGLKLAAEFDQYDSSFILGARYHF